MYVEWFVSMGGHNWRSLLRRGQYPDGPQSRSDGRAAQSPPTILTSRHAQHAPAWPTTIGCPMSTASHWQSPMLVSSQAVMARARHVAIDRDAITSTATWLAYEELPVPRLRLVDRDGQPRPREQAIDLLLLIGCLNFAFSDMETGEPFVVVRDGERLVDTDGMVACLEEAIDGGLDLCDGRVLAEMQPADLDRVFRGTITMPLLPERAAILREVGAQLVASHGGRFHRFVATCPQRLYADGNGLLERLIEAFPRFNDRTTYHGREVVFHKLAQLTLWQLHCAGLVPLADLDRMSAFADYIIPVALRVLGIVSLDESLARGIETRIPLACDSEEEVELRAASLVATALLTDAINVLRPSDRQIVVPQLDYRLWRAYHASFLPHHLTATVMY